MNGEREMVGNIGCCKEAGDRLNRQHKCKVGYSTVM